MDGGSDGHGRALWADWLIRLRRPAIALGLLLLGAGSTYLLVPPTIVADQAVQVKPADLIESVEREAQPMPSVLGLNRDVAQTVLTDAGLAGANVAFVDSPAAGPVGMVISQKPAAGTASVDQIELTVSVPAPTPDVLGRPMQDVRSQLEQLGAVVEIVPQFTPSVPKNQVVDVNPKPGEIMPTVVSLVVGDPGDALTLASVNEVDRDDCGTVDSATVNANSIGKSVECKPGSSASYVEYSLSRQSAAMEATVGTDDRGGSGPAHVVVLGDGRELAVADVWLGQSVPIRADLNGVVRLRIEATTTDSKQAPTVVLGDARLLGLREGLDAIAAQ